MLVALAFAYAARRTAQGVWLGSLAWADFGIVLLEAVFFLGSRDALRKYYTRVAQLLGSGRTEKTDGGDAQGSRAPHQLPGEGRRGSHERSEAARGSVRNEDTDQR